MHQYLDGKRNRRGSSRKGPGALGGTRLTSASEQERSILPSEGQGAARKAVGPRLLSFIWEYPKLGEPQSSWGVKESSVLRGHMEQAILHPGLGVSIATTQLAEGLFRGTPPIAESTAVSIGPSEGYIPSTSTCSSLKSHDQIEGRWVPKPDFRHTLAFGVILARFEKREAHVAHYRQLALRKQRKDGGWPKGQGPTKSELFSAIYAIELLDLCIANGRLNPRSCRATERARDRGREWIAALPRWRGLWTCGVLNDIGPLCDAVVATSWVLRRSVTALDGCKGSLGSMYRNGTCRARADRWRCRRKAQAKR
jgi:hypothetical protein